MKKQSKIITILISLSCVIALTVATHYLLTQIPDELAQNIDAGSVPVDVNAFDGTGVTPLMQAAIDSDVERAKMLLNAGADPNIRSANADQDYALNYALLNGGKIGSLAIVKLLLAHGANVHVADSRGMQPIHKLMFAAQQDIERPLASNTNVLAGQNNNNRWEMLKELVKAGVDLNAQAEDGSTMLHITVTNFDRDWIDTINKEYGQVLNYNIKDNKGRTPLMLAQELGMVSVMNTESVENSINRRPAYIGNDFNVKAADKHGRTGLELALIRRDMEFVKGLAEHGADLSHQDEWGNTPMHYAVANAVSADYVRYLLSKKAPVNIANKMGQTPLFNVTSIMLDAVRSEVAQLLLDAGSPIAYKDSNGKSVIEYAVRDTKLQELLSNALKERAKKQTPAEKNQPAAATAT